MSTAAVSVLVRIRRHPKAATETCCTHVRDQSEVVLNDRTFKFDRAFDESMTQAHVFDEVGRPTLDAVLQGYNGTILAYGQTGSGKTYTMAGGEGEAEGLMPRLLTEVFGELARRQREADGSFYRCTCSYLQIHNEQITDLLSPSSSTSSSLRIRETADRSTYVEGLRELRLRSATDALNALSAGGKRRESLPPMPKQKRAIVHELAKVYGIATASYDNEPRRHVDLFRSATAFLPGFRLSDAARAAPHLPRAAALHKLTQRAVWRGWPARARIHLGWLEGL